MSPWIVFRDGNGEQTKFECKKDKTLFSSLLAKHIPPLSVLVTTGGKPVSLFERTTQGTVYDVRLLERYDIEAIRELYEPSATPGSYTAQQLLLCPDELAERRAEWEVNNLTQRVEDHMCSILTDYQMITDGDELLVAYSGGIDSTALLLMLASVRNTRMDFSMTVLCIDDYWDRDVLPGQSPDIELLEALGLDYRIATEADIQEIYGLNADVPTVLATLENESENVLAVASHFNRRLYERYTDIVGADHICLGNQSTDLLAGFLGDVIECPEELSVKFPIENVGGYSYLYPLSFHTKQELAVYNALKTGASINHCGFDPWALTDKDTHYYYYLADIIQSYFPGILYWLANDPDATPSAHTEGKTCRQCGKVMPVGSTVDGRCAVCELLSKHKFTHRD